MGWRPAVLVLTNCMLVCALAALGCRDPGGPDTPQFVFIDALACPQDVLQKRSPLSECFKQGRQIVAASAPAGPDSLTVLIPFVSTPPDTAVIEMHVTDGLDGSMYVFMGEILSAGDRVADTLALPPFNYHGRSRPVEVTLFLLDWRMNGARRIPFADTTLVWFLEQREGPQS